MNDEEAREGSDEGDASSGETGADLPSLAAAARGEDAFFEGRRRRGARGGEPGRARRRERRRGVEEGPRVRRVRRDGRLESSGRRRDERRVASAADRGADVRGGA